MYSSLFICDFMLLTSFTVINIHSAYHDAVLQPSPSDHIRCLPDFLSNLKCWHVQKYANLNNINHNINNYKIHGLLSCSDWNNSLFTIYIYIYYYLQMSSSNTIYMQQCVYVLHIFCAEKGC